ncbi:hypothetical protein [Roseobacter sp.]|uniref:hypothetical protein n=1 Tax=Roseobacter sp. TaxID=1907202 RepID=UPI00386A89DA
MLGNSDRRSALLQYLVDKELSGEGNQIKAYTIAIDVLGRDASFDPSTDSIVRSEIGRLRDALRLYNLQHAEMADMRVEIPKGTYRPAFATPETTPERSKAVPARATLLISITLVFVVTAFLLRQPMFQENESIKDFAELQSAGLPYEVVQIAVKTPQVHGGGSDATRIAVGLAAELMMALSAYPWLSIIVPFDGIEDVEPDDIDYVLDGEVFWDEKTLEAQMRLVSYPATEFVWSDSESIELDVEALRGIVVQIASSVAYNLASNHGIAPELAKRKNANNSPENLDAYLCYLGVHRYLETPTDKGHLELRKCLLRAVDAFPEFGDAWAGLAITYIDEARFGTNARTGADPWKDAKNAVTQALKYAPLRMPSLNAALINSAEAPVPDEEEFRRISVLLLSLFPKHPATLYNVGSRAAEFLGRWDEGLALVDEAIELSPEPPSAFFLSRAYRAAMIGTDAEALKAVEPLVSKTAVSQLLLNYLAATRGNLTRKAQDYRSLLMTVGLEEHEDLVRHVKGRRYEQELETDLLEQLEGARLSSLGE